jgi:hypothetical protein
MNSCTPKFLLIILVATTFFTQKSFATSCHNYLNSSPENEAINEIKRLFESAKIKEPFSHTRQRRLVDPNEDPIAKSIARGIRVNKIPDSELSILSSCTYSLVRPAGSDASKGSPFILTTAHCANQASDYFALAFGYRKNEFDFGVLGKDINALPKRVGIAKEGEWAILKLPRAISENEVPALEVLPLDLDVADILSDEEKGHNFGSLYGYSADKMGEGGEVLTKSIGAHNLAGAGIAFWSKRSTNGAGLTGWKGVSGGPLMLKINGHDYVGGAAVSQDNTGHITYAPVPAFREALEEMWEEWQKEPQAVASLSD